MKYEILTKKLLYQLGGNRQYSGYDYIVYAIKLLYSNEAVLTGITKVMYVEIAKEFRTSSSCVERNIRNVINAIWKNVNSDTQKLLLSIFGNKYLNEKPSNKVFIALLYEYVKYYNLLSNFVSFNCSCPFNTDDCSVYKEIMKRLLEI